MTLITRSKYFLFFCAAVFSIQAWGAAKHPTPVSPNDAAFADGKRVVSIDPITTLALEMPDGSRLDFGGRLRRALEVRLTQSGHFVVFNPDRSTPEGASGVAPGVARFGLEAAPRAEGSKGKEDQWVGSAVPAVTLRVVPQALSFQTGFKGERMFYGFNEHFKSQFNDGSGIYRNEFPFRSDPVNPGWFGTSFEKKGIAPFDSRAGLDLGDGFGIDVMFAFLNIKYARFHSELHFNLELDAELAGIRESRIIGVTGEGYYYDVAGGYGQYSGAIEFARRDAMERAIQKAITASLAAIERGVSAYPLTAQVDVIDNDGHLFLGTGPNAGIRAGVIYQVIDRPDLQIRVLRSEFMGAVGEIAQGELAQVHVGDMLVQVGGGGGPVSGVSRVAGVSERQIVATESLTLPGEVLEKAPFPTDGSIPIPYDSTWTARLKQLAGTLILPYRIWRYFQYDQAYHPAGQEGLQEGLQDGQVSDASRALNFPRLLRAESWARRLGLGGGEVSAPRPASKTGVIVAVIDSGIDYNHPALEGHVWENGPQVGYDFISADSKPFDDGYHGTQVASLIAGVAPDARVMALKIFNPWGITNSASVLAAFEFALNHGAQIIVCAWATHRESQALELGIKKARDKGVVVVASAGDRGGDLSKLMLYPASLGARYENVLSVTGVDEGDQLMGLKAAAGARKSGFSKEIIRLAAPASGVRVAEPRNQITRASSSDLAAALVAGALACGWETGRLAREQVEEFLRGADRVAGLEDFVSGGLRLRFPKTCR
ncbi:S8 family serine peptidase [Bdellovibrionota bacterium FG-2]